MDYKTKTETTAIRAKSQKINCHSVFSKIESNIALRNVPRANIEFSGMN